jgi:hypothetical protein
MANVTLSWGAPPATDNVTAFEIYGANGTGTAFGSCTLLATVSGLTWTDTGLPNGQARTYYIVALNAIGASSPEGPINVTTSAPSSTYVQNLGSAPSVEEGTHAARPAAGNAGAIYIETDTLGIFRDNGTTWDKISGGGSGGSATETLISTVTTSGSQASVSFSSIPDTYKALIVRVLGRSNVSADNDVIILQFNGDTAANYNWVRDGAAQPGGNFTSGVIGTATAVMGYVTGALSPAGQPGWTEAYLPHYADTTWKKCGWSKFVGMGANPSIYGGNVEWSWNSTVAIADILVRLPGSNTFVDGSVIELIGVTY